MNPENSKRKKIKEDIWDISIYSDEEIIHNLLNMSNPTDRELEIKIWSSIQQYKSTSPTPENLRWMNFYEQIYHRLFSFSEDDDDDTQKEDFETQEDEEDEENDEKKDDEEDDEEDDKKDEDDNNKKTFIVTTTPNTNTKSKSNYNENTNSNANNNPGDSSSTKLVTQLQYATGNINPLLKETISRTLTIDSQYRDNKNEPTTSFILNLTETIKNVVNVSLYSIHIPYTWYTISKNYGSNYFFIQGITAGNQNEFYKISIESGNYSQVNLASAINVALNTQLVQQYLDICFGNTNIYYNLNSGIMTLTIDIQNIFNQQFYNLEFSENPLYDYTGVIDVLDASYISMRNSTIPSFLGLDNLIYELNVIQSSKNIPNTNSTYSGFIISSQYIANQRNPNYQIWIYQYVDNTNTLFNLSTSTILANYHIDIPLNTYSRNSLIAAINESIQKSNFLDISNSHFKQFTVNNTSNIYFEFKLLLNRNTTLNRQDIKIVFFIPNDSNYFKVWTGVNSCFQFTPKYTQSISLNGKANSGNPIGSYFPFYSNEIYGTYPTLNTNYTIGSQVFMNLNVKTPFYDVSQNNFILTIQPSASNNGYILSEYLTAINDAYNYPIRTSNLPKIALVPNPNLLYLYTFNSSDLSNGILKNQSTGNYDLSVDISVNSSTNVLKGVTINGTLLIPTDISNAAGATINSDSGIRYDTSFSIGSWVYVPSVTNVNAVIFNSASNVSNPDIKSQVSIFTSGGSNMFFRIVGADLSGVDITYINAVIPGVNPNNWNFFTWVVNGTTWTIYMNGTTYTSGVNMTIGYFNTSTVPTINTSLYNNFIGKVSTNQTSNLRGGRIDNFFICKGTLSASQVSDIYSKSQVPSEFNYYYTIPIQYFYNYTYSDVITRYNPQDKIFNPNNTTPVYIGNDSKVYFQFDLNVVFDQTMYTIDISSSPLYTVFNIGKNTGTKNGIINLIDLSSNNYSIDFSFNQTTNGLYDMTCDPLIKIYPKPNTSFGNQNAPAFLVPLNNQNNIIFGGNNNYIYNNISIIQQDINLSFSSYLNTILNNTPFVGININISSLQTDKTPNYYTGIITFLISNALTESNYDLYFYDINKSWSQYLYVNDNSGSNIVRLTIDPKLILFYIFDEVDVSGSGANRYLKNQATGTYDLLLDTGVIIDGTLNIPNIPNTAIGARYLNSSAQNAINYNTSFTIGSWVYFTNNNRNDSWVFLSLNPGQIYIWTGSGKLLFRIISETNSSIFYTAGLPINVNSWNFFSWVVNGTNWTIYMNGIAYNFNNLPVSVNQLKEQTFIGKYTSYPGNNLKDGKIDNFFIYNAALTSSQISDIYSKGQNPSPTNYFYTIPIQYFGNDTYYDLEIYHPINASYSEINGNQQVFNTSINIDNSNNTFYINSNSYSDLSQSTDNNFSIIVPNGIYSRVSLITEINNLFKANYALKNSYLETKTINGISIIYLYLNIDKVFTSADYSIIFYDNQNFQQCTIGKTNTGSASWDTTLGWILGFREYTTYYLRDYITTTTSIDSSGTIYVKNICTIVADTTCSTTLFNYFILALDDFNQNHTNDGLVTIATTEQSIALPSYAKRSDFVCDPNNGNHLYTGITTTSSNNLTQNQIYSITEIMNSNVNASTLYKGNVPISKYSYGPFITDVLAVIPIKTAGVINGQTIIVDGGTLQTQNRKYFGPINLNRLKITLYDDRGHIINLNNSNWSFTLLVDQIYKKSSASS